MSETVQTTWNTPPAKRSMRDIATEIAEQNGFKLHDLVGVSRCQPVARVRHQAFHAIMATGRFSTPQVGRFFGGRDHTTIIHGVRRHAERMASQ